MYALKISLHPIHMKSTFDIKRQKNIHFIHVKAPKNIPFKNDCEYSKYKV